VLLGSYVNKDDSRRAGTFKRSRPEQLDFDGRKQPAHGRLHSHNHAAPNPAGDGYRCAHTLDAMTATPYSKRPAGQGYINRLPTTRDEGLFRLEHPRRTSPRGRSIPTDNTPLRPADSCSSPGHLRPQRRSRQQRRTPSRPRGGQSSKSSPCRGFGIVGALPP